MRSGVRVAAKATRVPSGETSNDARVARFRASAAGLCRRDEGLRHGEGPEVRGVVVAVDDRAVTVASLRAFSSGRLSGAEKTMVAPSAVHSWLLMRRRAS